MLWLYIVAIVIGYLIGSISPSYILGKLIKGIDIRKHGTKNAGATNAFRTLGPLAGIITLIFDLAKGVLTMFIAYLLFFGAKFDLSVFTGTPFFVMCLVGFAAICGHNWPFYMQFKGGKGGATCGGIMILLIVLLFKPYFCRVPSLYAVPGAIPLIITACLSLAILIITGSVNLAAFICYPIVIAEVLIFLPGSLATAFALFTVYSITISIINIIPRGLKKDLRFAKGFKKRMKEIKLYRKILRFASLIFPIAYFWLDKKWVLVLIAVFFIIFLAFDFIRMKKNKSTNKKDKTFGLYKKGEPKISGFTLYLLSALIATAFFSQEIAILALIFAAVGDNFAMLLGVLFGRRRLFGEKTFQGTIACLTSSFFAGLIAMPFLNVSILFVLIGALAATIAELLSGFYDNITMAPFAAAIMTFAARATAI